MEPKAYRGFQDVVQQSVLSEKNFLDSLRQEIAPLRLLQRRISPRRTTAISLVATDGGTNQLRFDPFLFQLVRVVDSASNEYWLEAVTPNTPMEVLQERHLGRESKGKSPLARMMEELEVAHLQELSPVFSKLSIPDSRPPSWVGVYRELIEWATFFSLLDKDFGTDTLLVFDGLLRSKVFAGDLFVRLVNALNRKVLEHRQRGRRIYIVGVAKRSKVLDRYRLAMWLEGVLRVSYPAYVEVPREVEAKAYTWIEYARGSDMVQGEGEGNKFVGGKMFLVKFGPSPHDPIWPVDVFEPQKEHAAEILGYLLADAKEGFPILHYPASLQRAHEHASITGFALEVLQDQVFTALRHALGEDAGQLDVFRLQDADPARKRYGGGS